MSAGQIASGVPLWVWFLLAGLVLLGMRRLRLREVPAIVALLPAVAFLAWNLWNAVALAALTGWGAMLVVVLGGAAIGAASGLLLPEPRGQRLAHGRVRLPASAQPLLLYLLVFAARFAAGAWAAIEPARAPTANGIAMAVGAAATARLIVGVARWRRVGDPA